MAPRKILNLVLACCWLALLLQQPLTAAVSAEEQDEEDASEEVEDEELESEIAAQLAEGEGEETTGRSSSSSQSFKRLEAVCTDARVSFREMAQNPVLQDVYREFSVQYRNRDIKYFMQEKMVPSKRWEGRAASLLNCTT